MGKKKDLQRARQEMEAEGASADLLPPTPHDDGGKLKAVSILVTKADHRRLRGLALNLDNLHLQGLGTRALNAFLESHGQPRLTPVRQGKRSAKETD